MRRMRRGWFSTESEIILTNENDRRYSYYAWNLLWVINISKICFMVHPFNSLTQFIDAGYRTESILSLEEAVHKFFLIMIWGALVILNSIGTVIVAWSLHFCVPSNIFLGVLTLCCISTIYDATTGYIVEGGLIEISAFLAVGGGTIVFFVLFSLIFIGIFKVIRPYVC